MGTRRAVVAGFVIVGAVLSSIYLFASGRAETAFWIRGYDPETGLLQLDPVHPPSVFLQPELQDPPNLLLKTGAIIHCKSRSREVMTQEEDGPGTGHFAILECEGERFEIHGLQFKPLRR